MKDTDFTIKINPDNNQTEMFLPEFNTIIEFADNMVIVNILKKTTPSYQDYQDDLSPILHWINHMYNVDSMRETLVNPLGLSGNTKTFRRVYNQLMRETNAYKLSGVNVIADTE